MFVYSEDIYITNKYISDLELKGTESLNVSKELEKFKNSAELSKRLSGEAFTKLFKNIEMYQNAFNKMYKLCYLLANNIKGSNNGFLNYTMASPIGEPVDMRKIPEFEEQKKAKEQERDYCLEIITITKRDSNGKVVSVERRQRDPAKAAALQKEIEELEEIIEYLNRLPNEDNLASSKIEPVSTDCTKNNSDISAIEVSKI